ncbi:glycosyltransferase family 39 protein [Conexibacter sp. CPCC 206217]|uniref:glycosyltransferase family 39 protein n=1 Tax=Conexibacter sp. CPCC 206217 TaxID=3064574 RepID=UPI0027284E3F|nr:glycosyltransferase family 39 protein [Conexibacter sp. CPCC 206217]MDO8209679.1 glycosyltransferase family 39 protein [Conexibacter sp. CPCC 206217]
MGTGVIRAASVSWWTRVPARWQVAGVLALPYLFTVAILRGLTVTMPTYHGGDELTYHLPTIRQFADQFPGVDLVNYPAAQTPLYHLLVAIWGDVVGMELWKLRIVGLVASYGVTLVLYRLLRRHVALARWPAVGLALVFTLSPYVFGQSFILVTDNLGLLFALLAIDRFLAFSQDKLRLDAFALACLWVALALLTRQSYVWLGLFGGVWLLSRPGVDLRRVAYGLGLLALAAVPFAALVIAWRGIVPVGADPASCGLCAPQEGRLGWRDASPLRSPLFTLAVLGVYSPLLFWRPLLDGLRAHRDELRPWLLTAAAGAAVALVVLLVVPLSYGRGDEGYLWRVSRSGPQLLDTAWLFWILVPLGSAFAALGVRRYGWRSLPVVLFACFLVAQLATRLPYQKYFDPFVLLVCLFALRPSDLRSWRDALGPVAIVALSLLYIGAFAAGLILVES